MDDDRKILAQESELHGFTALERFKNMRSELDPIDGTSIDLSASRALRDAIHEYDPATDPPVSELLGYHLPGDVAELRPAGAAPHPADTAVPPSIEAPGATRIADGAFEIDGNSGIDSSVAANRRPVDPTMTFPVAEAVEPGDLLVLDPDRPGLLVRAANAFDPGVVGIAAGAPVETDGVVRVTLVDGNYATVKADAGYGEIRPGDLLTSSYTPGHAMRAAEVVPGTVIGKALEPLQTGTGLIRVLVMPR
jgi:hypothetical protein